MFLEFLILLLKSVTSVSLALASLGAQAANDHRAADASLPPPVSAPAAARVPAGLPDARVDQALPADPADGGD